MKPEAAVLGDQSQRLRPRKIIFLLHSPVPQCSTWDPRGGVGSRSKVWRWVGLGLGLEVDLGIRGRSWVGLGM